MGEGKGGGPSLQLGCRGEGEGMVGDNEGWKEKGGVREGGGRREAFSETGSYILKEKTRNRIVKRRKSFRDSMETF